MDVFCVVMPIVVLAAGDIAGEQVEQRLRVVARAPSGGQARGLSRLQRQAVSRTVNEFACAATPNEVEQGGQDAPGGVVVEEVVLRRYSGQARGLLPPRS
jgi:hypothetical protein